MPDGDRWRLPDGREGLEMPGSTDGQLRLAMFAPPGWPFQLAGTEIAMRSLCTRLPSRRDQQQAPGPDKLRPAELPDALL